VGGGGARGVRGGGWGSGGWEGGSRGKFNRGEEPAFCLWGAGAVEVGDQEGVRGGGRVAIGVICLRNTTLRRRRRARGDCREDLRVGRLKVELDAPHQGEGVWEEGKEMREEGFAGRGVGVDFWRGRGSGGGHCGWAERREEEG